MAEPTLDPPRLLDDVAEQPAELTVAPRTRRTAIVVAVVAVALLFVAALTSGGSDEPEETAVVVDTSVALTTTPAADDAVPTAVVPDSEVVAAESNPSVATAERTFQPIEVVTDAVPPQGRLVLWRSDDPILRLVDLTTSSTVEVDLDGLGLDLVRAIRGVGHRLVVEGRQGFWWIDADGGTGQLAEGGELRAYGDDEVWISAAYVSNRPIEPLRVGLDGVATLGPTLPPGVAPFGHVGDRLLVGGGSSAGVYIETASGWERTADGALVASGGLHLITRSCDAELVCSLERTSFETDESIRRLIPDDIDLQGVWWADQLSSPDARRLLVSSTADGSTLIWDLVEDSFTPVPVLPGRDVTWSDDGRWLFVVGPEGVTGVDLDEGQQLSVPLSTEGLVSGGSLATWLADEAVDAAVPSGG